MIVQKELVAIYDYEVPVPEDPFSFRLEIHKCSELFTGSRHSFPDDNVSSCHFPIC